MKRPNIEEFKDDNGEIVIGLFERFIKLSEKYIDYLELRAKKMEKNNGAKLVKSNYIVDTAKNGDMCIMSRKYNLRIATFATGTLVDAMAIRRILEGKM